MIGNLMNTTTHISVFLKEVHDPFETAYYIVAVFLFVLAYKQLQSCWKANNINLFEKVYTENKEIRERQSDARTQLRLIMRELEKASDIFEMELKTLEKNSKMVILDKNNKNDPEWKIIDNSRERIIGGFICCIIDIPKKILNKCKYYLRILLYRVENFPSYLDKNLDPITTRGKIRCGNVFTNIYFESKYRDLRKAGYHYEYLGILIKYKMIPFNLVFDLITWPDDFWNESYYLRSIVRKHWLPDFWENAEYLHDLYMDARLKGLISSGKYDPENLIYSKKTSLDHSNLSAYEHMSKRAYKDITDDNQIVEQLFKETDNDLYNKSYEDFKASWKNKCSVELKNEEEKKIESRYKIKF